MQYFHLRIILSLIILTCFEGITRGAAVIAGDTIMCSLPHSRQLSAYPDESNAGHIYRWEVNERTVGFGPTYRISFALAGKVDVLLETSINGVVEGVDSMEINILQTPLPEPIDNQITVCPNEIIQIEVNEKYNMTGWNARWYNNEGDLISSQPHASITSPDTYDVVLSKDDCPSDPLSIDVQTPDISVHDVSAYPDKIIRGNTVELTANHMGYDRDDYDLRWQARSTGIQWMHTDGEVVQPDDDEEYILTAVHHDRPECSFIVDTVEVEVGDQFKVYNSFTPNDDGINDVWEIEGLEFYPYTAVKVFNKWGNLVFSTEHYPSNPWNGRSEGNKPLPVGTYYYMITFGDNEKDTKTGTVTLIR